ncbi:MAG: NusG domain II-containing protein [Clostridia bacterium]|nr:NusG domain II-containing protein [Clostridia bacterium]
MGKNLRLSFQKGDIIAAAAVVLLALAVGAAFLPGGSAGENHSLYIYRDGALLHALPLNQNASLEISGDYSNTVTIQDGRAAITASDCPGEDCVHSGWISGPGRSIVCLPNRVELRIEGASEVDFVVG